MKFLQRGEWEMHLCYGFFVCHAGVHPKYLGEMQTSNIKNIINSIGEQFQVRDEGVLQYQ